MLSIVGQYSHMWTAHVMIVCPLKHKYRRCHGTKMLVINTFYSMFMKQLTYLIQDSGFLGFVRFFILWLFGKNSTKFDFRGIMGHTIIVGLNHNTAVSNANGFHWFCRQTSITGRSANKHMLVLNVSDPFFRERIMSHGHHFPHQNVTTIL